MALMNIIEVPSRSEVPAPMVGATGTSAGEAAVAFEWHFDRSDVPHASESRAVEQAVPAPPIPLLTYFRQVALIDGVACVVAFLSPERFWHVTTFVRVENEHLYEQVYDEEIKVLQQLPGAAIDFHTRTVPVEGGAPHLPAGDYFCTAWGSLDDAER